jgi:hypothetical protein
MGSLLLLNRGELPGFPKPAPPLLRRMDRDNLTEFAQNIFSCPPELDTLFKFQSILPSFLGIMGNVGALLEIGEIAKTFGYPRTEAKRCTPIWQSGH